MLKWSSLTNNSSVILLHRITSILIGLTALAMSTLLVHPEVTLPLWGVVVFVGAILVMFARMLNFELRSVTFWIFLGTPLFFMVSGLFFFLFLESLPPMILLFGGLTIGLWLYAENLFTFYHLPSSYQAYALEYLSFILFLLGMFYYASGAYAAQLFLLLPLWVPALAMFWFTLFAIAGVLWVSKIPPQIGAKFAWIGSVLLVQVFVALAFLPISFFVNAALFTVFFYLYLGLSRIHLLDKLSSIVLRRYVAIGAVLSLVLLLTATWT